MHQIISDFLLPYLGDKAEAWTTWISVAAIGVLAWLAYMLWSKLIVPLLSMVVTHTSTDWDDALLNPRVLRAFGQLLPALVVHWYLPDVFVSHGDKMYVLIEKCTNVYIVWAVWFLVNRLLKSLYEKLVSDGRINEHSSKGLQQMAVIIISCAAAVVSVSILIGRSPAAILTALGATSAVLMLVFKDTILGLVAGVQLSANKMLKKGDWIVVDRAGANGEVEDVSLTTVKVRNWDESITTIPPYVLVSESFQNYANMRDIGARRIARSLNIDFTSIRHLSPAELDTLRAEGFLGDQTSAGSATENASSGSGAENVSFTASSSINITLFRQYVERMLKADPIVCQDRIIMVRQLQPGPTGLPLELYFFVKETRWAEFEQIQADIFDRLYATLNAFHLRLYQLPQANS